MADEELMSVPRPGTTASLEARVARLERQYDLLNATVQAMSVDVAVTRANAEATNRALVKLQDTFDRAVETSQQMMQDPAATAAGKLIEAQIEALKAAKSEDHASFAAGIAAANDGINSTKLWVARISGGLAVLTTLLVLFGPAIRHALGMPS